MSGHENFLHVHQQYYIEQANLTATVQVISTELSVDRLQ